MKPFWTFDLRWTGAVALSVLVHYGVLTSNSSSLRTATVVGQIAGNVVSRPMVTRVIENPSQTTDIQPVTLEHPSASIARDHEESLSTGTKGNAFLTAPQEIVAQKHMRPNVSSSKFYAIEEVEQPALPALDWHLPTATIALMRLRYLIVKVWIAEDGDILQVDLISSRPQASPDQRNSIVASLMQTKMMPASINGQYVASQRTLEMALEL